MHYTVCALLLLSSFTQRIVAHVGTPFSLGVTVHCTDGQHGVHASAGGHLDCPLWAAMDTAAGHMAVQGSVHVRVGIALGRQQLPVGGIPPRPVAKGRQESGSPHLACFPPATPANHKGACRSGGCLPRPHVRGWDGTSLRGPGRRYILEAPQARPLDLSRS